MDFKKFSQLIMIEQTLFALPFAYIGVLFAGGAAPMQWLWVTVALVSARTAGMSFNRVLDADIDGQNPRTENRLIPSGEVSKTSVWILGIVFSVLLIVASFMLNMLCFYLSFVAVGLLFVYSLFKRFSSSSHFFLGFVEAAAPIGGYLAITGSFDLITFLPGIAIMFWIAGIDILYSIQDVEFDRDEGLFSLPSRFGVKPAMVMSALSYVVAIAVLCVAGWLAQMISFYWIALMCISVILFKQQMIVRTGDGDIIQNMGRVFGLNRYVSPLLLAGMAADILAHPYVVSIMA